MNEILTKPLILFIFSSPQEWILVVAALFLLFGANRLPELAKSLGQTRKAFKEGMRDAEDDEQAEQKEKSMNSTIGKPTISEIDDAALLDEIRRRKENIKQLETS